MMDGGAPYNPRTVEAVFRDFKGRQAGMIKALTTDVQEFYQQCDPEKKNLCLYGFPSEQWELNLPAGEVPPDLPEPTLGINFARDAMHEKDWLSLVAVHSDVWLLSVAFYFGARFGFDKADRKHLFNMINDLPTIFEVVTGAAKKQTKEKSSVSNHSNNKSKSNSKMVKTKNTVDGDTILATKATWDNELTMIFCELCVNEVNAGNRPTTHLNSNGWENVITLFRSRTQKSYEKSQLKNKWDTLKKEWRLWNELLRNSTGLEWCPYKKTIDATEEWWAEKIQENNDYKVFKMRGIEPRLNELMWQMFGDVVATGEHARAPSSSVLPGGAFGEDATPIEGSGDSDEHDIENEVAPDDDIDENASLETSNRGKQVHGMVQNKGKKSAPMKRSVGKTLTTEIENLCDGMSNQMKSVNEIVFSRSSYSVSDAMDALRAMENEIPRKSSLYFFATKIFQVPVKQEVFLNLDPDLRAWWLQCEYDEQNDTARFSSLLATPSCGFQPFQQQHLRHHHHHHLHPILMGH